MPKQKITEEMVVQAAFEIAREQGVDHVLVKGIAQRLGCSVQPIYSYCESMDGLRKKLVARTARFISEYVEARVDPKDYFKSTGFAHLSFAREEPHLFTLYFLRKRSDLHTVEDIYARECNPKVADWLAQSMGITPERAKALHLHMVLYSVGISSILATSRCDIPTEALAAQMEQAARAFTAQAMRGE